MEPSGRFRDAPQPEGPDCRRPKEFASQAVHDPAHKPIDYPFGAGAKRSAVVNLQCILDRPHFQLEPSTAPVVSPRTGTLRTGPAWNGQPSREKRSRNAGVPTALRPCRTISRHISGSPLHSGRAMISSCRFECGGFSSRREVHLGRSV